MPGNTSATGGYLTPVGTPALYGDGLYDFFNGIVAGITELDPDKAIFPAWEEEPPNLPDVGTDWAALRITVYEGDPYAAEVHNPGDGTRAGFQGSDTVYRHERIGLECSFYGPTADALPAQFRDGMAVAQNREGLTAQYMGFVSCGGAQAVPSLVKGKWLRRNVITGTFRRMVQRTYQVLDVLTAGGTVETDHGIESAFEADKPQT